MGHHKYAAGIDVKTQELTEKARIFAAEYVTNGGSAHAAAKVAGYDPKSGMGSKLLKTPQIVDLIKQLRDDVAQRHSLKAGAVREKLTKIAFAELPDVATYAGDKVQPKSFDELDEFGRASLKKIDEHEETRRSGREEITTRSVTVEQHDTVKALIALGKMIGEVEGSHRKPSGDVPISSEVDASRLTPEERATFRELLLKLRGDDE